jgi:hypothetical protein
MITSKHRKKFLLALNRSVRGTLVKAPTKMSDKQLFDYFKKNVVITGLKSGELKFKHKQTGFSQKYKIPKTRASKPKYKKTKPAPEPPRYKARRKAAEAKRKAEKAKPKAKPKPKAKKECKKCKEGMQTKKECRAKKYIREKTLGFVMNQCNTRKGYIKALKEIHPDKNLTCDAYATALSKRCLALSRGEDPSGGI